MIPKVRQKKHNGAYHKEIAKKQAPNDISLDSKKKSDESSGLKDEYLILGIFIYSKLHALTIS